MARYGWRWIWRQCFWENAPITAQIPLVNRDKNERYGCLDSDGDGYSDILGDDLFPENPTQWEDSDKDGWGDNQSGTEADQCLDTNWQNEVYRLEAENNFGCAAYQSDSDNDGITDDLDACPNTPAGAEVYPSGCKIEVESEPTGSDDSIFGMDPLIFYAVAGGGGLLFLGLVFVIISRLEVATSTLTMMTMTKTGSMMMTMRTISCPVFWAIEETREDHRPVVQEVLKQAHQRVRRGVVQAEDPR